MYQIKIARAKKLSRVGRYPHTCRAMLDALPREALEALTGRQIAVLLDSLHSLTLRTKAIHEADICHEGAVWDARVDRLRTVGSPIHLPRIER